MSTLDKLKAKFNEKPIPNDISFDEVERLANAYGCRVISGGKHSKNVLTVRLTKKAVFERENRILDGHKQTVRYIAGIAI